MVDLSTLGAVAAVVSAASIPLVMSAASSGLLSSAGRYVICKTILSKGQCERLVWDDMEAHKEVHECGGYVCSHMDLHPTSKCWQRTLGIVFSRAWRSTRQQQTMISKPEILPLNRNYICSDARTVLAFILCTVDYKPWRGYTPGVPWSPKHLRFDRTYVQIKELEEGTVVVHLEGSFKNNLTKGDIEGLLGGYPPWYRELVRMPHGPSVPHPITSRDDINRAGWVIAVGLTDVGPLSAVPHDGNLTGKPIRRTYDIINERLLPAFPNDINVKSAAQAVSHLVFKYTESGVEVYLNGGFGKERRDSIPKLSGSQATFAMRLFNDAPNIPLTADDIAELTPILLPVVDAAFRGAFQVVSLLKDQLGKSFYWPSLLCDPKQRVFIEDCAYLD